MNPLTIGDFAKVQEAMWSAREKWHNIGVRFKIGVRNLKVIGKYGDVDKKIQFSCH